VRRDARCASNGCTGSKGERGTERHSRTRDPAIRLADRESASVIQRSSDSVEAEAKARMKDRRAAASSIPADKESKGSIKGDKMRG